MGCTPLGSISDSDSDTKFWFKYSRMLAYCSSKDKVLKPVRISDKEEKYYCCDPNSSPPSPPVEYSISMHLSHKLIQKALLVKGGKFPLDNGNFVLEITKEKTTKKRGTKTTKRKTSTKKVPKKATKRRSQITSKRRR